MSELTNCPKCGYQFPKILGLCPKCNSSLGLTTDYKSIMDRVNEIEGKIAERNKNFIEFKRDLYIPNEVLDILPTEVRNILTVHNCFERGIPQACPPFMRKALATAITIRFERDNRKDKLYDTKGEPLELPKMIELAKQEHTT